MAGLLGLGTVGTTSIVSESYFSASNLIPLPTLKYLQADIYTHKIAKKRFKSELKLCYFMLNFKLNI
jgi:hypothetical protein